MPEVGEGAQQGLKQDETKDKAQIVFYINNNNLLRNTNEFSFRFLEQDSPLDCAL
jgi:hypothetical protein